MSNPFQILSKPPARVKDPVCGMMVDPESAAGNYQYDGTTYSFCNLGCLVKFRAEPDRYLHPEKNSCARLRPRETRSNTRARCTRRWCRRVRAHAHSAEWHSSP